MSAAPKSSAPSPTLLRAEAGSALKAPGLRRGYMDALEDKPAPPQMSDAEKRAHGIGMALYARVAEQWHTPPHWMPNLQAPKKVLEAAVDMGLTPAVIEGGAEAVGAMLDNARPVMPADEGERLDVPDADDLDDEPADDIEDDGGTRRRGPGPRAKYFSLPDDFPLTPIGKDGEQYFYLDRTKQITVIKRGQHRDQDILERAPDPFYLARMYPVYTQAGEWNKGKFNGRLLATHLITECEKRGLWSPLDADRGPGAWLGEHGELIMHLGDRLSVNGERVEAGLLGRYVYSAAPALPHPSPSPHPSADGPDPYADLEKDPGKALLETLGTWNLKRGDLDAHLLFCHLCASVLGGALKWRPVGWITGGAGTGKSSLHRMFQGLFGQAAFFSDDTTAAGVTSQLGNRTIPVFLDEAEAEEDNRKMDQLVAFARIAASGGTKSRSSASHEAKRNMLRSTVCFSSVLIPALTPADRSRMVIYDLLPLKSGAEMPDTSLPRMQALYGALLRRLIAGFPRFEHVLEQFRKALIDAGHSARTADVFGTLLAAGEIVLSEADILETAYLKSWGDRLNAAELAETADPDSDELRCLSRLRTALADPYKSGRRETIAQLCEKWQRGLKDDVRSGPFVNDDDPPGMLTTEAEDGLASAGLKIVKDTGVVALSDEGQVRPQGHYWLAVSNTHAATDRLFEGTHWQRKVYRQALRRLPGAAHTKGSLRIAAVKTRATLLPLDLIFADPDAHLAGASSASPDPVAGADALAADPSRTPSNPGLQAEAMTSDDDEVPF